MRLFRRSVPLRVLDCGTLGGGGATVFSRRFFHSSEGHTIAVRVDPAEAERIYWSFPEMIRRQYLRRCDPKVLLYYDDPDLLDTVTELEDQLNALAREEFLSPNGRTLPAHAATDLRQRRTSGKPRSE